MPALALRRGAAEGLVSWAEFDAEAERWGVDPRQLRSREDLATVVEGSTRELPASEHRKIHQEADDFVRWADVGPGPPSHATAGRTSRSSPASAGAG